MTLDPHIRRVAPVARCHPGSPMYALGLCEPCYRASRTPEPEETPVTQRAGHVVIRSRIGEPLTPAETSIVGLLCRGLTNKQIAGELGVSEQTVKNHMSAVLAKLGANDRAHAAVLWTEGGGRSVASIRAQIADLSAALAGLAGLLEHTAARLANADAALPAEPPMPLALSPRTSRSEGQRLRWARWHAERARKSA